MTDRQPKQRRHSMHRSVFLARHQPFFGNVEQLNF
jgi:hypothetical protein